MNYDESDVNTVVVSMALRSHREGALQCIKGRCRDARVKFVEVQSQNVWVRDWAPVQVGGRLIKFRYGYDKDNPQFPSLNVKRTDWNWLPSLKPSGIRLDGGNVVRFGGKVVMTDIIFRHNQAWPKVKLLQRLEQLLEGEITMVPVEPGDDIGHTDGICHFTPQGHLLVNDYSMCGTRVSDRYYTRLSKALNNFCCIPFPYAYAKRPKLTEKQFRAKFPNADTFNSGFGYYINFLRFQNMLLLPQFDIEEDEQALRIAAAEFPGHTIEPVRCAELSMHGGLLNCIAQTYKL
jgi:hypothetical protein